jgi:hypothetical protein
VELLASFCLCFLKTNPSARTGFMERLLFIDLLDDLGGDYEVELDYATKDFGIELSATQKSIFNEIEPKLGILRRIWYVTDQLEKIADTI